MASHSTVLDKFGERAQGLLERGMRIVDMAVVEVDVVGLQAREGALDAVKDLRARESVVAGELADLRAQDDIAAIATGPSASDRRSPPTPLPCIPVPNAGTS